MRNGSTSEHSVQERGLWCTELTFGAKNSLLVYSTRFQRHSVQKTGFSCTEVIFCTGNPLLWYGTSNLHLGNETGLEQQQPY